MKILRDWKVILVIVLLFVAGVVTGSVLSFVHFKHALERGFTVENWTSMTMGFFKRSELTPEQGPKVRTIVQETGEQFGQTFGQAIRVSGTNLVASWRRIERVLTPDQRADLSTQERGVPWETEEGAERSICHQTQRRSNSDEQHNQ